MKESYKVNCSEVTVSVTSAFLSSSLSLVKEYGNTEIHLPDVKAVNLFFKIFFRFSKTVIHHCMTEKVNDSEDTMRIFFHYVEYIRINLNSRIKLQPRIFIRLVHGRPFCISTQCLNL